MLNTETDARTQAKPANQTTESPQVRFHPSHSDDLRRYMYMPPKENFTVRDRRARQAGEQSRTLGSGESAPAAASEPNEASRTQSTERNTSLSLGG